MESGGSGDLCVGMGDSPDDMSDLDLLGDDEDFEDIGDDLGGDCSPVML